MKKILLFAVLLAGIVSPAYASPYACPVLKVNSHSVALKTMPDDHAPVLGYATPGEMLQVQTYGSGTVHRWNGWWLVRRQDGSRYWVQPQQLSCSSTNVYKYHVEITIASGFLNKEKYQGTFSFHIKPKHMKGRHEIEVDDISFIFRGDTYTRHSFDSIPKAIVENGEFKELQAVGGPHTKRFGLNAGCGREQFGREEEAFVRTGDQWLCYLDPDTYVEGAGRVKYRRLMP